MKIKQTVAFCLAFTMVFANVNNFVGAEKELNNVNSENAQNKNEPAKIKEKSEVIYGKLTGDGKFDSAHVVNHFDIEKEGLVDDYGNYSSLVNLTESIELEQKEGMISFYAPKGSYYYQGNTNKTELPWFFEVEYFLNDEKISIDKMAGETGKVTISIKTKQNKIVDSVFYNNYLLQISVSLNAQNFKNIISKDATIAEAGNNKMITFTVMPKKDGEFSITGDAKDFEMDGIQISAVPFSANFDIPSTEDMINDFSLLSDAVSKLNEGLLKISEGTAKLSSGSGELKKGSSEFKKGLSDLKTNSSKVVYGSNEIENALKKISSSLNVDNVNMDLSQFTQLTSALKDLSYGLNGVASGLNKLKSGFGDAYNGLNYTVGTISDESISMEQISSLFKDVTPEQQAMLNKLYASHVKSQEVKNTYNQVKPAFASISPTLENINVNVSTMAGALEQIANNLETSLNDMQNNNQIEQFQQLAYGLKELSDNYTSFNKGLNEYIKGVSTISDGYTKFDQGVVDYLNGVDEINKGLTELSNGTKELNANVEDLPEKAQQEIDSMLEDYSSSDFTVKSYTSEKNKNTTLVQFVLKTEPIKIKEEQKKEEIVIEDKKETFVDRFVALFK